MYFKKEVRLSSEMNYTELSHYIQELQQGGFDVIRLRVQLHKKFAFPLIVFVMSVLAVPFSLSAGRRGALTGIAVAIGIGALYWVTAGLFEALGNVNQLPAALAACFIHSRMMVKPSTELSASRPGFLVIRRRSGPT